MGDHRDPGDFTPRRWSETTLEHRMMRLPQVMAQTGMSRSWIYQAIVQGTFPAPIKLGRASCWEHDAVQNYLRNRLRCGAAAPKAEG